MIVECVVCHRPFEAKKTTKKYCSDKCMYIARNARAKGRKDNNENGLKEKFCPICGTSFTPKTAAANQRTCCYNCMPDGVQLTRGMFLAKIKEARGGKCIKCGYSKCVKALEFHHTDPSKKDFTISNDHFKLQDAVDEAKKCVLICSNCHKELHDGLWSLEDIIKEKEEVNLEFDFDE